MKIIDIDQNTPDWLTYRKNKIGASDIAQIMGISPFGTKLDLWKEKQGLSEEFEPTAAMIRGKELEGYARALIEEELGRKFPPILCESSIYPWACASLDGFDGSTFIEIKCPMNPKPFEEIPPHYYAQMQWQFMVMDFCDSALYCVYNSGKIEMQTIYRDDDYIAQLVKEAQDFYNSLLNFEMPEPSSKDWVVNESAEWVGLAQSLREVKTILEEAKKEEEKLKKKLADLARGKNMYGHGVKISSYVRKGNIKYSQIPELSSIDIEKYRGAPTQCVRVSVEPVEEFKLEEQVS